MAGITEINICTNSSRAFVWISLGMFVFEPRSRRLNCRSFFSCTVASALSVRTRRQYGSVQDSSKFQQRLQRGMGFRHYVKLRAVRVGHPHRQVCQRSILLLHHVHRLSAVTVWTNDQQPLPVPGVKAVVNRHLRTVGVGSMSLASA